MKIAFFPYKISMWDSLESIWEAAQKDESCECQLVPIPYYTKNDAGEIQEMHYEGDKFPTALDYKNYFLEQERPDIMYIHNPYDQYNKVTMVEPRFFSRELKKTGGVLVYVPYYMAGYCAEYKNMLTSCGNIGAVYSDYIVLQNNNLKAAYEFCGFPEHRLLALGSPKVDAVYKIKEKEYDITEKWKNLVQDRKVILLNTSISRCVQAEGWLEYIRELTEPILQDDRFALIWRPHPLLWDAILVLLKSDREYAALVERIIKAPNAVIDDSDTAEVAIGLSDAMISDYSSMVMQYTFSGKPVYMLQGSSDARKYHVFCDYFSNYFMEDGCSMEEFLALVLKGEDCRKAERLQYARESVENSDGSCGEKIHQFIIKKVRGDEKNEEPGRTLTDS